MPAPVGGSSTKISQPTSSTTTTTSPTSTDSTTKTSSKSSPTDTYLNRARSAGEEIPQTCITRSSGEEIPQTCLVGGVSNFSLTSADFSAK